MKHLIIILSLISLSLHAEEIPGMALYSYFSANCRSQGEWTKAALQDSVALATTLHDISKDVDCQGVGGAVAGLNALSSQLNSLDRVSNTQAQIARLSAQEQELMVQLSQTNSQSTIDLINTRLIDVQTKRAEWLSDQKSEKDFASPGKVELLQGIISNANSTFIQLAGNQKCLAKNPGVLQTATSIMASVGATAAMVNPALGMGLTAGAVVLGTTIEGIRNIGHSRDLRKIADGTIAQQAYACALETMGDRWCQMKDAEAFLNFKENQRLGDLSDLSLGKAVRLADREIPALIEWLSLVKAGAPPSNSADSRRINQVIEREAIVNASQTTGVGLIGGEVDKYYLTNDRDERWNIIRSIINTLAPPYNDYNGPGSSNTRSPLGDILSKEYAPFFLLGLTDDRSLQDPNGNYYTLSNWPGRQTHIPDIELLKNQYLIWVGRARSLVDKELLQVRQPDPLKTLSAAFEVMDNRYKTTPMQAIDTIVKFLEKNPPTSQDQVFVKLYDSTVAKLKAIHDITDEAVKNWQDGPGGLAYSQKSFRDPRKKPRKKPKPVATIDPPTQVIAKSAIERIYETARLQYGTVVLQARLEMIVRIAVLEYLRNAEPKDRVLVAQLLAANRFTDTLNRLSGENLSRVRQDIEQARPITINNLNAFGDIFGKNINKILARLYNDSINTSGSEAKAHKDDLTQMCFKALAIPRLESFINTRYCVGLKLSGRLGAPDSEVLGQTTFSKDVNDRACMLRDFYRHNKIYEDWRYQQP